MRYVSWVVFAVIVVAVVAVYIAEASEVKPQVDSSKLLKMSANNVKKVNETAQNINAEKIRQQQEAERQQKVDEAVARFGSWGPQLVEASEMYGQDPAALYRVMSCESRGDPYADNGTHKGLFQFHPGTWASTPYGGSSIYDGRSQIFAAAWMWSQGRKGEWSCQ